MNENESRRGRQGSSPDDLTPRIARLREATLTRVDDCHIDRARLVTESYKATEGEPAILRRAKAISQFILNVPLAVFQDELLVGDRSWVQPYEWNYPDQWPKSRPEVEDPEWARAVGETREYWLDESVPSPTCTTIKGHCVPGFQGLLEQGFEGIAAQAEAALKALSASEPQYAARKAFLQAEHLLAQGCAQLGRRFAELAREMADTAEPSPVALSQWERAGAKRRVRDRAEEARRQELLDIAQACDRVPAKPARSFREAVQSLWFGELLVEAEDCPNAQSPGRLDQLLFPYYKRDLEAGRITRREAKELLSCLWLKLWAPYDVHDVVIGGLTPDGRDATNELSEMILEVQRELGLRRQFSVRYHTDMSPAFLSRICDCLRDGLGVPQLFNDDVLVPAMADSWLPIEAARGYSIIGCIEMTVPGEADPRAVAHYSNLPECLEWALNDGKCLVTGERMGLTTGDPLAIRHFDDLFERYKLQAAYEIEQAVVQQHEDEYRESQTYPMPLLSLLTEDCIKKGRDITEGGARYNSSMYCAVGIPNVADSLAAMKKLVFDEGRVDLGDLINALRTDFEGAEPLRRMLMMDASKYGNDEDYVDEIALQVATHYAQELSRHRDPRGGPLTASFFSFTACVHMGQMVGATPDGRQARTPLANSLCAAQGNLRNGPTSLLKSAAKLRHRQATGGTAMLLDLHPSMVQKVHGHDPLLSLIRTYFDLGGSHVEVSLIDDETLRRARDHPEGYRHLTVRVAGYSARFVDLSADIQEHIIERTRSAT